MIYIGSANTSQMSGINQLFFDKWGQRIFKDAGLDYDFSLLKKAPLLDQKDDLIFGDWHPNESGHKKIAKTILESQNKNSIRNFIDKT